MRERKTSAALALLALLVEGSAASGASEWWFCLAQDEPSRRVYTTAEFRSNAEIEALEQGFNDWLDQQSVRHTWGTCARASSRRDAKADLNDAIQYNASLGLQKVDVPWSGH